MKLHLSDKDRRTLFIFLSLIVVLCSLFFVYMPNNRKVDEIKEEIAKLEMELKGYQNKELQVKKLQEEIKMYAEDSQKFLSSFPTNLTQEKAIAIMRDMEEKCNVKVGTISFSDIKTFYNADIANDETQATAEATTATATNSTQLTGYNMNLMLEFTTTYEDTKNMIDFFNQYPESMSITSFSIHYDTTNGDISGDMGISMYCVPNGAIPYIEPYFENVPLKKYNLFESNGYIKPEILEPETLEPETLEPETLEP